MRKESWGTLIYTNEHSFEFKPKKGMKPAPYVSEPLILNIDLTFSCNMQCPHCVAMDMAEQLGGREDADLRCSEELLEAINESRFMVVVITGGEPLLNEYRERLIWLIEGIRKKGVIIDTNGTIMPSPQLISLLQKKRAMVRISWDIPDPTAECHLRRYTSGMYQNDVDYMLAKESIIEELIRKKVTVSVQSVLHLRNYLNSSMLMFPKKLRALGIKKWYIQRYIPSYKTRGKYSLSYRKYEKAIKRLTKLAEKENIECITKLDRRHNSVFLLVKDGQLYTQSDEIAGNKVPLGKIGKISNFFEYVSAPDHSARYYPEFHV